MHQMRIDQADATEHLEANQRLRRRHLEIRMAQRGDETRQSDLHDPDHTRRSRRADPGWWIPAR
jgi:hypothetical protein